MPTWGYHCSHEQHSPRELLDLVQLAEQAGFEAAMCSDHFAPWSEDQGHSGFAWSWIGAALQATRFSLGVVNAPGQRYHPAIIAQAAATLAQMFPGRFWLAVGSGEAVNEHITGERWPPKQVRNERLRECVDVIRALHRGETVSHEGLVTVDRARLWSLPDEPPRILGAAVTPETAEWVGGWADGLITIVKPRGELREVVEAFRRGGGREKPLFLQVHLSYADTEEEALQAAHEQWRFGVFRGSVIWNLELPEQFDVATRYVRPEDVRQAVRVSADLDAHVRWLREDAAMGFAGIYLHNVGRNQRRFIEDFGAHVLPALRRERETREPGVPA